MISVVGAPGSEDLGNASLLQLVGVLFRDRPADDDEHVLRAVLLQPVENPRDERHMRTREDRDADRVGVLLNRGLDDLLRSLVEPRVDDLHACVAQRTRDDLRATIVSVETGLCDHDSDLFRHAPQCKAGLEIRDGLVRASASIRRSRRGAPAGASRRPCADSACALSLMLASFCPVSVSLGSRTRFSGGPSGRRTTSAGSRGQSAVASRTLRDSLQRDDARPRARSVDGRPGERAHGLRTVGDLARAGLAAGLLRRIGAGEGHLPLDPPHDYRQQAAARDAHGDGHSRAEGRAADAFRSLGAPALPGDDWCGGDRPLLMGGPDDRQSKQSGRWCRRGMRRRAARNADQAREDRVFAADDPKCHGEGRTFRVLYLVAQKTGVSLHTPHTALSASHISPIVT